MKLPIRLDHFLQIKGAAQTGGHAKLMIDEGEVLVNGEIERRRRRKLNKGDIVSLDSQSWTVSEEPKK